jgi:tetratricopeptide (TPR) repeat protein
MKSIKSLNEACDPYPLLDVVNERLADLKSKKHLRGLLIYKALALREMGDFTSCSEILESIDLDQKAASPILKILYYINLADIYINLNKINEAQRILSKAYEILQVTRLSKRNKLTLERYYTFNHFTIEFSKGITDGMEEFLLMINKQPLSKRFLISSNLATAEFYLRENKVNIAKEYLQFVIDDGNKLYDAVRAQKMMDSIEEQVEKQPDR